MKKVLTVEGMSCQHCAKRVKEALEAVSGVAKAEVDLGKKRADVEGEAIVEAALRAAVEDVGYSVMAIS
jgi:Cu+-exporting ATPase